MELVILVLGAITAVPKAFWGFLRHPLAAMGALDDTRRLGIVRIMRRDEVSGRIPSIPLFLDSAENAIIMPVYAPSLVRLHDETVVRKVDSGVNITVILPDPRDDFLMNQISRLASEGGYYSSLKASLETLKSCYQRVHQKDNLATYVTTNFMWFTGIIIDASRATVTFAAEAWPTQKRLVLQLRKGELLRNCIDTCRSLMTSATRLESVDDYDTMIEAAGGPN